MAKLSLNSALLQMVILGCIFFAIPGMWNSINSMAGGIGDSSSYSTATAVLYGAFAVVSFAAPVSINYFGARPTLFAGSLGYIMFVAALWQFSTLGGGFLIASGAVTGVSAGLLWTAQGALVMAYPTPERKGQFIAIFWVIFNLGGVVGGVISFATNYSSKANEATSATYIAYIVVMSIGAMCILTVLLPPEKVVRPNGEAVVVETKSHSIGEEVASVGRLFLDKRMLLLAPYFLSSNWFYTYQFSVYNGVLFNARTQGLNNIFYWAAQMAAAIGLGRFLDSTGRWGVRGKAILGFIFVEVVVAACWSGAAVVNYNESLSEASGNSSSASAVPVHRHTQTPGQKRDDPIAVRRCFCERRLGCATFRTEGITSGCSSCTSCGAPAMPLCRCWRIGSWANWTTLPPYCLALAGSTRACKALALRRLGRSTATEFRPTYNCKWINIGLIAVSALTTALAIHMFVYDRREDGDGIAAVDSSKSLLKHGSSMSHDAAINEKLDI